MAFGKAIFTKSGRFHWAKSDWEISLALRPSDLELEWFVAELFYPDFPDYDVSIHAQEIENLLSKPDELVKLEITDSLREKIEYYGIDDGELLN